MGSLGITVILGTVGSLIFCLPVLVSIHYVQPIVLLRDTSREFSNGSSWKTFVELYSGFWYGGLAVWVAGIIRGGIFYYYCSCYDFASSMGLVLVQILWLSFVPTKTCSKIALRSLNRNRIAAISCFLSMSLGTLLVNLIPQLQEGIIEEIERPDSSRVPTFLFLTSKRNRCEVWRISLFNKVSS